MPNEKNSAPGATKTTTVEELKDPAIPVSLHKKLLTIQDSIDAFVKDGSTNTYSYVNGNQVLNSIRPLMNELNLLLKQEVVGVKYERIDYTTQRGNNKTEILCLVDMLFTWINCENEETDTTRFTAMGMNDFDKGIGSALTYGERYFLLKFFHVPTDALDPDALQDKQGKGIPPTPPIQPKQPTPGTPGKKDAPTPPKDEDKKWMDKDTKEYAGAVAKLYSGETTIEKIALYFKISKAMRADFKDIIAKGKAVRGGN